MLKLITLSNLAAKVAQSDSGQLNLCMIYATIFVNVRQSPAIHVNSQEIKAGNAVENNFREQRLFSAAL